MSEEPEKMVVELTISPESPCHKSARTIPLENVLKAHGIEVNFSPCDDCEVPCEGDREPRRDMNDLD